MPSRKQDQIYSMRAAGLLLVYGAAYWYFFLDSIN